MPQLLTQRRHGARPLLGRTREIARVLAGHGLDSLADQLGIRGIGPRLLRRHVPEAPRSQAQRVRLALGELGVTFVKLGQMLSTHVDLLPQEFAVELSRLQDDAPRVPYPEVEATLREDLGHLSPWPFAAITPEPLASASIGQVHAARLLDGDEVVVKVRRPGVIEQVERDIEILRGIVDWVQTHTPLGRDYELRPLVDEFAHTLRDELDYRREADNARRLARHFESDARVWIPRVYDPLSTERVLTLERVGGVKISDLAGIERLGVSRCELAENAVRLFLRQLLEFGFFHADPHPGNFFVQPGGRIAIVDFGMVGRVNAATREHLLRAGIAAVRQDAGALAEQLYALGVAGRRANREAFQRDLDHVIHTYGDRSLRDLSAATVTGELARIVYRHRLQIPGDLALLLRVINMGEGLGLTLNPDFRYLELAGPIIRRSWRREHSLRSTAARVGRAAANAVDFGIDLPQRAAQLLGRFERGDIQLIVQHQGLEEVTRQFQLMTNRLALAVILGASVVALGLAAGIRHVPALEPYITWLLRLALVFSLVFGASVLWGILRAGRRRS